MSVTENVFQVKGLLLPLVASPLLKDVALLNIEPINTTEEVFQLLISWLKELAPANILAMLLTLLTFQELIF